MDEDLLLLLADTEELLRIVLGFLLWFGVGIRYLDYCKGYFLVEVFLDNYLVVDFLSFCYLELVLSLEVVYWGVLFYLDVYLS